MNRSFPYRLRVIALSVLILLTTLSVLGLWTTSSFMSAFDREAERFFRAQLDALCSELTQDVSSTVNSVYDEMLFPSTSTHNDLYKVMRKSEPEKWRLGNAISDMQNILNTYRSGNESLRNIYLYIKHYDVMLTCGKAWYLDETEYRAPLLNWTRHYDERTGSSMPVWALDIDLGAYSPDQPTLMAILPAPLRASMDYSCLIAVVFNAAPLEELIARYAVSDEMQVLVMDTSGTPLLSNNALYTDALTGDDDLMRRLTSGGSTKLEAVISGQAMTLHSAHIPGIGWHIVSAVPSSIFYQQADMLNKSFLILLLACAALSTLILCTLLLRYFHPLKRLVLRTGELDSGANQFGNEFLLLDDAITTLTEQAYHYQSIAERDRPLINLAIFMKWLIGSPVSSDDSARCLESTFGSTEGRYCVAALRLDATGTGQEETLMLGIRDMCMHIDSLYPMIMEPTLLCLILHMPGDAADDPQQSFNAIRERIFERYPVSAPMGISDCADSPEELHTAWVQAHSALEYRMLYPMRDMIAWSDAAVWNANDSLPSPDCMQRIIAAIKALDAPELRRALTEYRSCIEQEGISIHAYRSMRETLLHQIEHALGTIHAHNRTPLQTEPLHELLQECNIVFFFEQLYELISRWIMLVTGVRPPSSHMYVDQAQQYILTHMDQPISLVQIADALKISGGHLSRLFKEHTGESFIDYLTRVRMERMCELLVTSDESIQQIVRSVGFINTSYCIRLFKQTYGVTPRQYRLANGEGDADRRPPQ